MSAAEIDPQFTQFLDIATTELHISEHDKSAWILRIKESLKIIGIETLSAYFLGAYGVNKDLTRKGQDAFDIDTSHALLTGAFTVYCPDMNMPTLYEMLTSAAIRIYPRHGVPFRRQWCNNAWSRLRNIGIFTVKIFVVGLLEIDTNLELIHNAKFGPRQTINMLHATWYLLTGFEDPYNY